MTARLTARILGCGSSGGVPRPALGWGDCDPGNPKNRRRRVSIALRQNTAVGETTILVDDITNIANAAYAAWPERIYVIAPDGRITYKGGMGPFYFDPEEIVPVLEPFTLIYGSAQSNAWQNTLPILQRERAKVVLRAQAVAGDAANR